MNLFSPGTPILAIVARTFIIYFVVLIGFRLTGKREVGQFTPFDLVLILLIANAVQNAMVGPDTSLTGGIVAAVTLLTVNFIVSVVADRNRFVRELTVGEPTILVHNGQVIEHHMRREHITIDELGAAMREHGIDSLSDVQIAVLEVDGTISIVPVGSKVLKSHRHIKFLRRKQ